MPCWTSDGILILFSPCVREDVGIVAVTMGNAQQAVHSPLCVMYGENTYTKYKACTGWGQLNCV